MKSEVTKSLHRGVYCNEDIIWHKGHREQLWQLIEAGLHGVAPGDLICKSYERDLRAAGYAIRNNRGQAFSTPLGERSLRDGHLNDGNKIDSDGSDDTVTDREGSILPNDPENSDNAALADFIDAIAKHGPTGPDVYRQNDPPWNRALREAAKRLRATEQSEDAAVRLRRAGMDLDQVLAAADAFDPSKTIPADVNRVPRTQQAKGRVIDKLAFYQKVLAPFYADQNLTSVYDAARELGIEFDD